MEIIKWDNYRSEPFLNMQNDMVRLTITGTNHEIRRMLRCLEEGRVYFKKEKVDD